MSDLYRRIPVRLYPEIPWVTVNPFFGWSPAVRESSPAYLATPPYNIRVFTCRPASDESVRCGYPTTARVFLFPAVCTYQSRHHCGARLHGHDPGDEDPVRP